MAKHADTWCIPTRRPPLQTIAAHYWHARSAITRMGDLTLSQCAAWVRETTPKVIGTILGIALLAWANWPY